MTFSTRALAASLALLVPVTLAVPTFAQAPKKGNLLQRHPKVAGVAAAVAAHHMAKKGAGSRRAMGKKPNFAERHPMATGVAAGAAAHHMLKKH